MSNHHHSCVVAMIRPGRTAVSHTLSAVALSMVCGLIAPAPAAAQFSFTSQSGAWTSIEGNINAIYVLPPACPAVSYGQHTQGGDGVSSATDSDSIAALGGTQTSTVTADASSATLHAYVKAGDGACTYTSPGNPPVTSTVPMVAAGEGAAEFYDTYTVSSLLPAGTQVEVTLVWRVNGSFSALVPASAQNGNQGGVYFQVQAGSSPAISTGFVSSQGTQINDGGTVKFTAAVGSSFKIVTQLTAHVSNNDGFLPSFAANVSASAVALSTDPAVFSVTGAAHSGGLGPLMTTALLPDGAVGHAYSAALSAAYGTTPYAWSLSANSAPLPAGLSLSAAGLLTGTPTVAGTFPITVQVTDAGSPSQSDTNTFSLRIFPVSLSALGTATIDGVLSPGEWDNAACQDTVVNVPGGGTTPARLCVMNDTQKLYVALRFDRATLDAGNSFSIEFGHNRDFQAAIGDDGYVINPDVGFTDIFRTNLPPCPAGAICGLRDVDYGGTNDGAGTLVNNGTVSVYETSHPLNSGDVGHDMALAPGDAIGFWFFLRMIRSGSQYPQDFGDTYYPGARIYGRIIIAAANAPTPAGGNVVVAPADPTTGQTPVTLTFDRVSQPGTTHVTSSPSGPPPPAGFQLGAPAVYYEITTTATYTPSITVCVNYSGITFSGPPRLFHYQGGAWVDVTTSVDTVNQIVCGQVSSLSPFAIFQRDDVTPPVTTRIMSPAANASGWNNSNVVVTLNATDSGPGASGVNAIHVSLTGAQTGSQTVIGYAASVTVSAEGTTTLTYFAVDNAGNQETAKTLTVRIDKTAPTVTCSVGPNVLWPPNHQMVPVTAVVTVNDAGSGPAGFTLTSVISSEPDLGLGDGDRPNDIQGFTIGGASGSGQLRAERSGLGSGRIYTLTYTGRDVAGNSATCAATETVPHDRRR